MANDRTLLRRTGMWLGWILAIGSLVLLGRELLSDSARINSVIGSLNAASVALAFFACLVAEVVFARVWIGNVRRLGSPMALVDGLISYFRSGLMRFLPGAVVPYVVRTGYAVESGTSAVSASVATGIETVVSATAALTLGTIGLASVASTGGPVTLLQAGAGLLIVMTVGATAYLLLPRLWLLFRKDEAPVLRASSVAWSFAGYSFGWMCLGTAVSALVSGLGGAAGGGLVASTAAMSLGWFAGFVAVPVPGGLGVREAVFAGVLGATVGIDIAILAALAHRIVWSLVTVACGVGAFAARPRRSR